MDQLQVPELKDSSVVSCPVDCQCDGVQWGLWSSCSETCGPGSRERRRNCLAAKNGGVACHSNPLRDDQFAEMQQERCSTHTCPKSAHWGQWGSWSSCTQTCYDEGTQTPLKTRSKTCIEATLSTNAAFNRDIVTCKDLLQIPETESIPCGISLCPGEMRIGGDFHRVIFRS